MNDLKNQGISSCFNPYSCQTPSRSNMRSSPVDLTLKIMLRSMALLMDLSKTKSGVYFVLSFYLSTASMSVKLTLEVLMLPVLVTFWKISSSVSGSNSILITNLSVALPKALYLIIISLPWSKWNNVIPRQWKPTMA